MRLKRLEDVDTGIAAAAAVSRNDRGDYALSTPVETIAFGQGKVQRGNAVAAA